MTQPVPYLNIEQRIQYLHERNYFDSDTITSDHRHQLESINFHYFLGYARNLRTLADKSNLEIAKHPDIAMELISDDHRISEFLYRGLRKAEWILRNRAVEHYCQKYDPYGSFLADSQYAATCNEDDAREVVRGIISHALRHGEPYVLNHIAAQAQEMGIEPPKRYDPHDHDRMVTLVEGLPLWSIIDSFSLGLLSKFIERCNHRTESKDEVWRRVAQDMNIPATIFLGNLHSLTMLRNLVAHHSRLWMRPTTESPRKPRLFSKNLRDSHNKSMHVAFYNLALFQGSTDQQREFSELIDTEIDKNNVYKFGVTKVRGA